MNRWRKVYNQVINGANDSSLAFDDVCGLLERIGFERRTKGSHNVFRRSGVLERLNLQRDGKHAKPYQVKQVRDIIVRYRLGEEIDG